MAIGSLSFLLLIALFARVIDASMEVNDLKSQVRLQKQAIAFMEAINDRTLLSCAVKVADFEVVVKASAYVPVTWYGDSSLVGPFQVKKRNECMAEIKLVGLP
jgi:hypothetical protein